MAKTRRNRQRGAGYLQSQQWFDPKVLPPTTLWPTTLTTAPTADMVRPVLTSTFQSGAGRKTRVNRKRGGFSPSVMGSFLANAQAAVVPLALYAVYHTMVPKTGSKSKGGKRMNKTQRKANRK